MTHGDRAAEAIEDALEAVAHDPREPQRYRERYEAVLLDLRAGRLAVVKVGESPPRIELATTDDGKPWWLSPNGVVAQVLEQPLPGWHALYRLTEGNNRYVGNDG